jgi:hypothetical protein
MSEEYRQLTRNQVRPSIQEGEMLLFQNSGACYNCGKFGHCVNECTARKNSSQNQRKKQDFKANVVPMESKVILPEISGPRKRTRIKGQKIGRKQTKKLLLFLLK